MEELYKLITDKLQNNEEFIVVTIVDSTDSTPRKSGARMLVEPDGSISGTIGGGILEHTVIKDALEVFAEGSNVLKGYNVGADNADRLDDKNLGAICGGRVSVYFEIFKKKDTVFIFGGGHVGQKLAALLSVIGFPYCIVDNRNEYATKDMFPCAREVYNIPYSEIGELPVDASTYCVIMTHGHKHDALCLEILLESDAKYIGMIGSMNKVKNTLKALEIQNIVIDSRVYSPVGLSLTGSSPGKLAVSVLAEILAVQAGKTEIVHLREKFINQFKDDPELNEIFLKGGLIK